MGFFCFYLYMEENKMGDNKKLCNMCNLHDGRRLCYIYQALIRVNKEIWYIITYKVE